MDTNPNTVLNPHASRPDIKKIVGIIVLIAGAIFVASNWEALKAFFGL